MVGKNTIVLDAAEWLKGMSSGSELGDGGFSTDTEGLNLISEPGVLYAPAASVDGDSDSILDSDGEIIISINDNDIAAGSDSKYVVTDTGRFLSYNGTKLSAVLRTDSVQAYATGFSEAITAFGEHYITSKTHLARWDEDAGTFTAQFIAFTNTNVGHPAVNFESKAYFGDGNLLKSLSAAGGAFTTELTLPSTDVIRALGVDPGTGKMLISTTEGFDASFTLPTRSLLQWYSGTGSSVSKYVEVGDPIFSFKSVGSTVFVGWGRSLGFINGSGVQFLRDLKNVTYAQEELPYPNKITSIGSTLYIADGDQVLAYGPVQANGPKIFYYALQNKVSSAKFRAIFGVGQAASSDTRKIGLSLDTELFRTVDLTDSSGLDKFFLMTNWFYFPRPVHIRNIQVEFFGDIASTGNLSITLVDQERDNHTIASLDGTITSRRVIRKFGGFPTKLDAMRLQIENATTNAGLKRVIIYYDVSD